MAPAWWLRGRQTSRWLWTAVCALLSVVWGHAAVIKAASCSERDVEKAIDATGPGDTVLLRGPCSATWRSGITIAGSHAITVAARGGTVSIAGAPALNIDQNSNRSTRITGFTFLTIGGSSDPTIRVSGRFSPPSAMARIDHNSFRSTASGTWIETAGAAPVLIDHNSFSAGGAAEMIHNVAFGPDYGTTVGWTTDVVPGSPDMVFIENNVFNCTDTVYSCSSLQAYYGARTVFRDNTNYFSGVDQHGTEGLPWARWWEIYNNRFFSMSHNQCCYMQLRGGSGVVWGNTHPDANQVEGGIGLLVEAPGCSGPYPSSGYPARDQIGRGIDQTSNSVYFWNNSDDMPVVKGKGRGCLGTNIDYAVSAHQPAELKRCESVSDRKAGCPVSYDYAPYAYPFPLNRQGLPRAR